jgi:dethiobiotin synthetase
LEGFMRGLFFTGTDTGVGKTFVTAAVVRLLRRQDHRVAACKPVATGASRIGQRWLADDTLRLADAAAMEPEQVTPFSFPDPVAPPLAARRQGVRLTLQELTQAVHTLAGSAEAVLVEGVGGLLCPLTEEATVADLITALRLPAVVVARRALGTLNHTLLTLEAAERRELKVAGVIVNSTMPSQDLADETNVEELRRLGVPVLATIPHQTANEPMPELEAVDWWRLCQRLELPAARQGGC